MLIDKELLAVAKEKMGEKSALIIAEDLKLELFDEKNLKACCPFHAEKTPSFVFNTKKYSWHCFGCSISYSILDHYMTFYKISYLEACEKLFIETEIKFKFGEKGVKTKREYKYPALEEKNDRSNVEHYLALRKISKETLDYCDIREDKDKNIVFNYYDTNDVLLTVKYRPARKVKKGDTKTWAQKNVDTSPILFNMSRVDPSQPLLITEGCIDTLSAIEAGFKNSVSVPFGAGNYAWIEENWDWLEQFDKIIIFSDNDEAGIKMKNMIVPRLGEWRCYFVDLPREIEKDGKFIPVKDINEVLYHFGKEKVLQYINTANEIPISYVKDYSEIKRLNAEDKEGVRSGIAQFDKYINKFMFGCLAVTTGSSGSGKSVFANHIYIAEPLNQGYDCFLFTGELSQVMLKEWLDTTLVGRRHVQVKDEYIKIIKPEMQNKIDDWTKGRLYIYDNDLDSTAETLLKKMEELVRKKGIRVFILDNLMKIDLQCANENIYVKQKEFCIKLANFANKYKVLVHLIAHPRKIIGRLTKMDISGSGDITNLAHYVLGLHRVTRKEAQGIDEKGKKVSPNGYSVMLDLFKNRMTGVQDKEIGIYFDTVSYRFWTTIEELDKAYKFDKGEYKDKLPDPRDKNLPVFMRGD